MKRFVSPLVLLLCLVVPAGRNLNPARAASGSAGYSDGKYPSVNNQLQPGNINWTDWKVDTFGCKGKRWTYIDSIDRSIVKGLPMDTVVKYLGAPLLTEHYEAEGTRFLFFRKKQSILYHIYPITSDCKKKTPWYALRIYYDNHSRVLGMTRVNP